MKLPHRLFDKTPDAPALTPLQARGISALYWLTLVGASVWLLRPLWLADLPAVQDFGGHLSLVDIWLRYDESTLYQRFYELRDDLSPNLLPPRIAALCSGWLDPITTLRALIIASLVGTIAATAHLLRVFDRSRWLIIPTLPLICWNGMVTLGLLNNLMVLPFMLLAVAFARRYGEDGRLWHGVGLMSSLVIAYFCHGIGYAFAFAVGTGMLLLSIQHRRELVRLWSIAPSLVLWGIWLRSTQGREGMPGIDLTQAWGNESHQASLYRLANRFSVQSVVMMVHLHKGFFFTALFIGWLLLLGVVIRDKFKGDALPPITAAGLVGLWLRLRRRPLLLMTICLLLGFIVLPTSMMHVPLSIRLVTPIGLAAIVALELRPGRLAAPIVAFLLLPAILYWGGMAHDRVRQFQAEDLTPMQSLIEKIPRGAHAHCAIAFNGESLFYRRPLIHACYGLLQAQREALVGSYFTWITDFNAVKWRRDLARPDTQQVGWERRMSARFWSYLLVRNHDEKPGLAKRIATARGPRSDGPRWALYAIEHRGDWTPSSRAIVGDLSSPEGEWLCLEGEHLDAFDVSLDDGKITAVTPLCAPVNGGPRHRGPDLGEPSARSKHQTLTCPPNTYPVGLRGHLTETLTTLALVCRASVGDSTSRPVGEARGEAFELLCPEGQTLGGVVGRATKKPRAIGTLCRPTHPRSPPSPGDAAHDRAPRVNTP